MAGNLIIKRAAKVPLSATSTHLYMSNSEVYCVMENGKISRLFFFYHAVLFESFYV